MIFSVCSCQVCQNINQPYVIRQQYLPAQISPPYIQSRYEIPPMSRYPISLNSGYATGPRPMYTPTGYNTGIMPYARRPCSSCQDQSCGGGSCMGNYLNRPFYNPIGRSYYRRPFPGFSPRPVYTPLNGAYPQGGYPTAPKYPVAPQSGYATGSGYPTGQRPIYTPISGPGAGYPYPYQSQPNLAVGK